MQASLTSCMSYYSRLFSSLKSQARSGSETKRWVCGSRKQFARPSRSPLEHLRKPLACGLHTGNEIRRLSGFEHQAETKIVAEQSIMAGSNELQEKGAASNIIIHNIIMLIVRAPKSATCVARRYPPNIRGIQLPTSCTSALSHRTLATRKNSTA